MLYVWNTANADDTVLLKPSGSSRTLRKITGTITQYTGNELLIRTAGGRESSIPSDRVEDISFDRTQSHIDGDVAYQSRQFAEALRQYRQAMSTEKREWVRRMILARVVRCQSAMGQDEQAGVTFLLIVRSDPATQYFSAIPLTWRPKQLTLSHQKTAQAWLANRESAVARLLGASWLLAGDASQRTAVRETFVRLRNDRDPRVAHLSNAQLWRMEIAVAPSQVTSQWQGAIARMPTDLRAGPYYLHGQLLARHGQSELAALAFLRVPIQYPDAHYLAGESLLAAAGELEKLGQTPEAIRLLQETQRDYAGSTIAKAAAAKLATITRRED